MKQGGFLKRKTKLNRKSKSPLRKLQDEIWQHCRRIIKSRYILLDGTYRCFTCDKPIEGQNCQLGHFIPNSVGGTLLRYNLDNLRLQCYYENINLGGNGSEFYRRMVLENGQEFVDNLFKLKYATAKAKEHYENLLKEYSRI